MRRTILSFAFVVAAAVLSACPTKNTISCTENADCLQGGVMGTCLHAPESSEKWCAFSDPNCAGSSLRWGVASGDGLAAECVDGRSSTAEISVTAQGAGVGRVVSDPAGIDCGSACRASFSTSQTVSIRAEPDPSSWFMGFGSDCSGRAPCDLDLATSRSVTATFEPHGKTLEAGQIGAMFNDSGIAAAVGSDGSQYVGGIAGAYEGPYDGQALLAKLDATTGQALWTRFFTDGNSVIGSVRAVAVDGRNNDVVIAGWFGGHADFDGHPTDSAAGELFVARLDASTGIVKWVRQVGASKRMGAPDAAPMGLTIDHSGNEIVAASTGKAFTLAGDDLAYRGQTDAILVKLSSSGAPIFARAFGGTGEDLATTVATDAMNDIYVGGWFETTVVFGDGTARTASGEQDGFVSKWTSTGAHSWTHTFGSSAHDATAAIVSGDDRIYVTGEFAHQVNLGGFELQSINNSVDGFIAAYSLTGTHLWSRSVGASGTEQGVSVCLDDDHRLALAIRFTAGISLDEFSLVGTGTAIATLSPDTGSILHASPLGIVYATTAACGPNAMVATGWFSGTLDIDGRVLTSQASDLVWQTLVP